ncbi:MAG TPA: DUF5916 domain-containing protein [Longimicrobiales bacterium]|nr:DUF5916 domain-containing protein [Longimicrobiales bacterium]
MTTMKMTSRGFGRAVVLMLLVPGGMHAQKLDPPGDDPPPIWDRARPVLAAVPVQGRPPRLDGRLDDDVWRSAQPAVGFTQFEPTPGAPASQRTEARVVYADDALYVGIRAWDSAPDSIAAQLTRRDQGSYSDVVGVVIDSYFDRRTAFHFEVNPQGVKTDIYRFDDTAEDRGWDAVWDVATVVDEEGWSAEFRIPYSQLRFRDGAQQTWGINFVRRIARLDELSLWAPTSREDAALVSRMGELTGLRNVKSPTRMEINPYSLGRLAREEGNSANPFYKANAFSGAVGADVKYGVTSDLTLNVTINPDFGQVESDPAQVNLSAFETFLPERRPFFVEGSSFFNFGLALGDGDDAVESLFYSRRVGRAPQGAPDTQGGWADADDNTTILGAWKLSGKTAGGWSVGIMNAVTAEETAEVITGDGTQLDPSIEPFSNYAVVRVARDFREGRTALGVISTSVNREKTSADALGLRSGAYTGGVDFRHRFAGDNWQVNGYFLASHIRGSQEAMAAAQLSSARYYQRPDADHVAFDPSRTSLSGVSGYLAVSKISGGRWRLGTLVQTRSPGFDVNDAGYLREADFTTAVLYAGYAVNNPMGPFRRWRLNANGWTGWTYGGESQGAGGNINGSAQLANFWSVHAGVNHNGGGVTTALLRGGPAVRKEGRWNGWGGITTDSRSRLQLSLNTFWNRATESGSWGLGLSPTLRFRPSGRATLSLGSFVNRSVNDLQWLGRMGTEDPAYLFGEIDQTTVGITARMDYAFTPTLSLQLYAQPFVSAGAYSDFKRVSDPMARSYRDRVTPIATTGSGNQVLGDFDGDGTEDALASPDFNFKQFRSNAVLRWEYRPGSALFLVWAQGRGAYAPYQGDFSFGSDFGDLFGQQADDIFMVKLSYWFNP